MISFEPLKKYMKEKTMSISELSDLIKINRGNLSQIINGKVIPQSTLIDKICKALNCSISDVIEWVEVAPEKDERFKIKWDIIPLSMYSLSLSLGKSRNAMRNARKLDSKLLMSDIKKIAELCNLNVEDLINEVQ